MAEQHKHGFVSKCLVSSCAWNGDNQCNAPGISIAQWKENHDCVTWIPEEEFLE